MANSDVIVRIKADAQNYDANLAKATKTLDNFKKNNLSLGGIANQATSALTSMATSVMGVTAAMGAAYKVMSSMVSINKQFEQSSANLAAVMGTSKDQITDLTQQAKTLGATTQYTATQILELQANLARLGFNQEEILNSTKSVQAMATAMGADLGEAANLAGAALRGFGMNASEMERVASVLSVGTTKSALSFEKLATALPIVQTAAAKTGFTIEDTVAMLGKLTDNGINAASAATQLRKILNDSTTAGTKLANALGGPVKSFDELVLALDKASRSGQNHADSVALVNSKNATALDILRDMSVQREVDVNGVKKQTSALQDLRESITDCSDGMRAMQDEQLNTLQGSITILGSAWEGLMLTFSESNGTIKSVVDGLAELLQAWTKWRNRNAGGDAAIQTYELGGDPEKAKEYIEKRRGEGVKDEGIKEQAEADKEALDSEIKTLEELEKLYAKYDAFMKNFDYRNKFHLKQNEEYLATFKAAGYSGTKASRAQLQQDIAARRDQSKTLGLVISQVSPVATEKDEEDNIKLLRAQYEAKIKEQVAALDRMSMNEEDYESKVYEIKKTYLQMIADLYQEETVEKARALAAISQLEIQHQATMMRLANKTNSGSGKDPELTALEKRNKRIQELTASIAEMNNILATSNDANEKAWATNQLQAYNDELDRLNGKLKETATNVTELPTKFELIQQSLDKMSTGVGAISTLGNSFNELKSIGDDLASAFSGEMDAWDALMTVFNSGIGIMETVIGVMEAINTLQELSSTLSKKKVLEQGTETAAVVAGKMTESQANIQEAGTSMLSAGANAAQSSSAAGKAVAGIPIVGPILAVAAIAAVLGATIAAMSKAKSAGHFSGGGMILGNSYSGDNLTANVNSGELILNRAQQGAIAGQLEGNPMNDLNLGLEVEGTKMLLLLNNTNRSLGGSRSFYSERH